MNAEQTLARLQITRIMYIGRLVFVIAFLAIGNTTHGQIKIDLKTKLAEKNKSMQAVKEGVKSMMERVSWIQLTEVGEKYSVWIEDLSIAPKAANPSISVVSFRLEVRTPAMFTSGKLIRSTNVSYESDISAPLPFSNPPEMARALEKIDNKTHMSTAGWIATSIGSGATLGMAKVFVKIGSMFQSNYTEAEKTTGLLGGYYSVDALYRELQAMGEFK